MSRTEIIAEIARLRRVLREWELEGRLDCEVEDEMQGEILDLQDELYWLDDAATPVSPGGAFNDALFAAAMGTSPEEIFGTAAIEDAEGEAGEQRKAA